MESKDPGVVTHRRGAFLSHNFMSTLIVNCKCSGYIYGAVKIVTATLTHLTLTLILALLVILKADGVITLNLK